MNGEKKQWRPGSLWNHLKNKTDGEYEWRKESRDFANCYVCHRDDKEVGFIPVEYDKADAEWKNWWRAARQRHDGLTLKKLMNEIVKRHQSRTEKK